MSTTQIVGNQIRSGVLPSGGAVVTTGTIAPTATPSAIGAEYVNTATGAYYKATGTDGSWNWAMIGQGSLSADYRDNLVGCWDATNGPTPTTNASAVTGWNDLGSALNHLVTSNVKPTYYVNIQNGLPAVYFGGVNHNIYGANLADIAQATTHFLVFKPTQWDAGAQQYMVTMMNSSQTLYKVLSGTTLNIFAGTALAGASLSTNTCYLATAIFNGASSSIAKNADAATSGNAGTGTNTMYPLMGTDENANSDYVGYIMEWRVYTGALTTNQQLQVRAFLNNKWGIY